VDRERAGHALAKEDAPQLRRLHTLERVVRSTHDSAGFVQALQRMAGYANQSTPLRRKDGSPTGIAS